MKKYVYSNQLNTQFCSEARTLDPKFVGNNDSGWIIQAQVHEDYYEWVNYFEAFHPDHGLVYGDFESEVFASSDETLAHFLKHHPFDVWDYYDI